MKTTDRRQKALSQHSGHNQINRSKYTLQDALIEIGNAEAILDGLGATQGLTLWGRIASIKEAKK